MQFIEKDEGEEELSEEEELSDEEGDSEQLQTETTDNVPDALESFTKLTVDGKLDEEIDSTRDSQSLPTLSEEKTATEAVRNLNLPL